MDIFKLLEAIWEVSIVYGCIVLLYLVIKYLGALIGPILFIWLVWQYYKDGRGEHND